MKIVSKGTITYYTTSFTTLYYTTSSCQLRRKLIVLKLI